MTQQDSPRSKSLTDRAFKNDDDFWKIHAFLIETHGITGPGFNWDIRRWEGWRFYEADPSWNPEWERQVHLWETATEGAVDQTQRPGAGPSEQLDQSCPSFPKGKRSEVVVAIAQQVEGDKRDRNRL